MIQTCVLSASDKQYVRDCGCVLQRAGSNVTFTYCALHGAAPALVEAFEAFLEVDSIDDRLSQQGHAAVNLARGK